MALNGKAVQTNLVLVVSDDERQPEKFKLWTRDNNNNLQETLQNLEISRIALEIQKKVFEHPLEDGSVIVDHTILEPKRATIQAYISNDDSATLMALEQAYLSDTVFTVKAGTKIIENAIISSQPHEISSEVLDKTLYSIAFKEAQEITPTSISMAPKKVKNKTTASRVNSGVKQTKPIKKSWLKSLISGGRT